MTKTSPRLLDFIDALPLKEGLRILEIGCGTGVAAREIANRLDKVYILAIDRSAKAIEQARRSSIEEISTGKLRFEKMAVEKFESLKDDQPFDFAFAIRVGALDGRHPEIEEKAKEKIKLALKPKGKLYIDGGNPLMEIVL